MFPANQYGTILRGHCGNKTFEIILIVRGVKARTQSSRRPKALSERSHCLKRSFAIAVRVRREQIVRPRNMRGTRVCEKIDEGLRSPTAGGGHDLRLALRLPAPLSPRDGLS